MLKLKKKDGVIPKYRDGLPVVEKLRYDIKLAVIGDLDPYEVLKADWSEDVQLLPTITYPDIVNYLVFSPSPYTLDDLKCYKGLEAYNQFVCGWVRERVAIIRHDHCVITAKVLHSQKLREKPLQPWVIAKKEGTVVSAHCNCMAGLGEACTHVAALLFAIEATVKVRDSKTVTEEKAYWLLPTSVKKISYKEVNEINFSSAKTAKRQLDATLTNPPSPATSNKKNKTVTTPAPTSDELLCFYDMLHNTKSKPAILSLIPPYSDNYIPKPMSKNFPLVLTELLDEKCEHMDYNLLLEKCDTVELVVTKEQSQNVEAETRDQCRSKMWYRFRAGRITASKMKAVCSTNQASPSQSLIKAICYPELTKFTTKATAWGCEHEQYARNCFLAVMEQTHENCRMEDCGFIICPEVPHVGASPDGMFTCDCCGTGCIEIKCPYCIRAENTEACTYLSNLNGNLALEKTHPHYYQVQTQLGVCQLEFGYFVVWTEADLHIEIIPFDCAMWQMMCERAQHFFNIAILPELTGKFFTRPCNNLKAVTSGYINVTECSSSTGETVTECSSSTTLYCYCNQVAHGDMIACDNNECVNVWFHYRCIRIEIAPKGKWYCPDCRKLPAFKRRVVKS